jgi:hypothetical protein
MGCAKVFIFGGRSFMYITYIIRAMSDMMEAACTSETSVDIQFRTRQYIPEDSELHGGTMINV